MWLSKKSIDQNVNLALDEFSKSIKAIERGSTEALALVIFVNGCYDSKRFTHCRYNALLHYPRARDAARHLVALCDSDIDGFCVAIREAHTILRDSDVVRCELVLSY
ncbi:MULTISPECIES: hypothetical protein [Vibrio oreintalis group]|uniref:Uncharacterized protein n=1 Tax=Vibrio europaeus TaxID=300876 RepID=A0A178J5V5_9VIBR|nr:MULTISPECIES: hypothetical protein [Vibrio oreintalis group]MCG9583642.1 hypothetical protein [Vibrio tubiashii]MCG9617219.1 hypothetical protein [Vibrio tubiashii]MCG9687754.1 hypothetical protein [Vibrio tubiashii]MCG9752903.1 hypothetical protein [Vibrio brasiliensis]MDC5725997.1 hypothetical protein [Vibrio europaeus]